MVSAVSKIINKSVLSSRYGGSSTNTTAGAIENKQHFEWKRFNGQWLNYVKTAKVNCKEKDYQTAIFLAHIGMDAYEIFNMMEFDDEADKVDLHKLIDAFEKYCIRKVNKVYKRYVWHRWPQESGESFNMFLNGLWHLVKSQDYSNVKESTIRDRIVLGIRDDTTVKKLLQTRKLDLSKAISICHSAEALTRQLKAITSPDEMQALSQQLREQLQL